MKRFFILLITLLLTLSLFGCNEKGEQSNEQSSQAAESSEESKPENTKKLVSKKVVKNGTGKVSQTSLYKYNEKGQACEITNVTDTDTRVIYTTYDKFGYEADTITKDANGKFISHHQFERDEYEYVRVWRILDEKGNVKSENVYDVTRDDQGRMLEVYFNGELSSYYSYDEQGNVTERAAGIDSYTIYDKDGNVLERGSSTHKQTNTYENGRLTEINSQYGDTVYKTLYEYDGELLLSLTNYENDVITVKYLYEYDQDGDRTKETMQNGLGIASSITEYYYDEFVVQQ